MNWTIWQRKPKAERPFAALARDVDGAHFQLVHWTGEGSDPETECRVVDIAVDSDGTVTVEQSTSRGGDELSPEYITRFTLPGWGD